MTKTTTMRIAVEELTTRNFRWIEVPQGMREFWDEVNELLEENDAEEWVIADYEGFQEYGISLSPYENLDRVNELAEILEDLEPEVVELIINNFGEEEGLEILEEQEYLVVEAPDWSYSTGFNDGDLAYILWEDYDYWTGITTTLSSYIDWKKLERDLLLETNWVIGDNYAVEVINY